MNDWFFDDGHGIDPEGLALLRSVVAKLCRTRRLPLDGDEARPLAASLIALFKSGFRSEAELLFMSSNGDEERQMPHNRA